MRRKRRSSRDSLCPSVLRDELAAAAGRRMAVAGFLLAADFLLAAVEARAFNMVLEAGFFKPPFFT